MKIIVIAALMISFALTTTSCSITHSMLTNEHYKVGKLAVFDACDQNGEVIVWMRDDLDGSYEIKFPSNVLLTQSTCYIINDSINKSNNRSDSYDLKTCNNISGTTYNPQKGNCFIENSVLAAANSFNFTCNKNNKQETIRFVRTNTFPFRYILLPIWVTADIISFPYQLWQYHELASNFGSDAYEIFFKMWSYDNENTTGCVPLPKRVEFAQQSAADGRR